MPRWRTQGTQQGVSQPKTTDMRDVVLSCSRGTLQQAL